MLFFLPSLVRLRGGKNSCCFFLLLLLHTTEWWKKRERERDGHVRLPSFLTNWFVRLICSMIPRECCISWGPYSGGIAFVVRRVTRYGSEAHSIKYTSSVTWNVTRSSQAASTEESLICNRAADQSGRQRGWSGAASAWTTKMYACSRSFNFTCHVWERSRERKRERVLQVSHDTQHEYSWSGTAQSSLSDWRDSILHSNMTRCKVHLNDSGTWRWQNRKESAFYSCSSWKLLITPVEFVT